MVVNTIPSDIDPKITTPVVKSAKALGSEDFMKLLAVQFQTQDPMKPMDDTAFIAQMAQFTSLSQTQTMTSEMLKLSNAQQIASANSFIGKQVTVDDGKGGTTTGNVAGVLMDKTGPNLVVNGAAYPVSSVIFTELPAVAATTASTANSES